MISRLIRRLLGWTLFLVIPLAGQNQLTWSGYWQTDLRILVVDSVRYDGHELRLDLKAEARTGTRARWYAEIWARELDPASANRLAGLINQNLNLTLREAYVSLQDVPWTQCDLRLGRQRIAWGTADKLNPTDNINPPDLEDIWDFGRHLGSDAVQLKFYPGAYTISAVILPWFEPAVLPRNGWASIFVPSMSVPPGMTLRAFDDSLLPLGNNPAAHATLGMKASRRILGYDLSLSYVWGREHLPLPRRLILSPADSLGGVNVRGELAFPRRHVFGADLAGAIRDVGVWLETAVFLPEQAAILTMDLSALGLGTIDSLILPRKPYCRFTAGLDYTFPNGIYAHLQFLHGFLHERGSDQLEDYLMTGMEWKLCAERIKIMPLSGGVEIKKWQALAKNCAVIFAPEISYQPVDNAELTVGGRWIEGSKATTFGRGHELSEIFLRFNYSF